MWLSIAARVALGPLLVQLLLPVVVRRVPFGGDKLLFPPMRLLVLLIHEAGLTVCHSS